MIQLFVPFIGVSLNSIYSGSNWNKRQRLALTGHKLCVVAVKQAGISRIDYPVTLTFTPVLGKGARAWDCSNYSYTAKILEDGLVAAGVLKGDSNQFVKGFAVTEPVVDRSHPTGMQVRIEKAA